MAKQEQKEEGYKSFFCLWKCNGGDPPRSQHETLQDALNEAERLVKKTGDTFYVLHTVGLVRPSHPPAEFVSLK